VEAEEVLGAFHGKPLGAFTDDAAFIIAGTSTAT